MLDDNLVCVQAQWDGGFHTPPFRLSGSGENSTSTGIRCGRRDNQHRRRRNGPNPMPDVFPAWDTHDTPGRDVGECDYERWGTPSASLRGTTT